MAQVFEDRGCDVARVQFHYAEDPAFLGATDDVQFARIASDGRDIVGTIAGAAAYRRVWIVGKSLGTLSMGAAVSAQEHPPHRTHGIWLTPSLLGTPLLDQMLAQTVPSLAIIGSRDPSNRPELIDPIGASDHIDLHVIPGADHAFAHEEGTEAAQALVAEATDAVSNWVDRMLNRSDRP